MNIQQVIDQECDRIIADLTIDDGFDTAFKATDWNTIDAAREAGRNLALFQTGNSYREVVI